MNITYYRIIVFSVCGFETTVLATPLLKTLRELLDDSTIHVAVRDRLSSDLLGINDLCDEAIPLDGRIIKDALTIRSLRGRNFTHSMVLFPGSTSSTAILSFLSGAEARIAHTPGPSASKRFSFLFNQPIAIRGNIHDIQQNLNFVSFFDPLVQIEVKRPFLKIRPEDKAFAQDFIGKHKISPDAGLVGMDTGSDIPTDSSRPDTRWSTEKFIALGDRLIEQYGATLILFQGAHPDNEHADILAATRHPEKYVSVAKPDLGKKGALISTCSLFLSNDTGLMHVSASLRVPTVGIFGPTDPERTGPVGSNAYVVHRKNQCPACNGARSSGKPVAHTCLTELTPDDVWNELESQGLLTICRTPSPADCWSQNKRGFRPESADRRACFRASSR